MGQPSLAVLIPEGTRIDESLGLHHPNRRFPRTARILCPDHEDAPVRIAAKDIEPAIVITDGRCPDTVRMLHLRPEIIFRGIPTRSGIVRQRCAYQRPIHQIPRMQDRQSRKTVERGSRHIIILPHPAHVRIAVIRVQDRIKILELRPGRKRHQQQESQDQDEGALHKQRDFHKDNHFPYLCRDETDCFVSDAMGPGCMRETGRYRHDNGL